MGRPDAPAGIVDNTTLLPNKCDNATQLLAHFGERAFDSKQEHLAPLTALPKALTST